MDALRKKEMGLYAGVWMVLFALSFVPGFPSRKSLLPFFVLFVAHDALAVPFLTRKRIRCRRTDLTGLSHPAERRISGP